MNRPMRSTLLIAVALVAVWALAIAGDAPWFDMENCGFCKNLTADPALLEHMSWEQYSISNGIVSVTTVDKAYADSYKKAYANMEKLGEKMKQGTPVDMCSSCTAFGMIMMKGPKSESVNTKHGMVWIMTSDDAAVVAELQKWAKRNMEELAKAESGEV